MTCENVQEEIVRQWRAKENVAKLATWLWNSYVIRDDAYASYNLKGEPFCVRATEEPILPPEVLISHCRGEKVVGLYTTEPQHHTCITQTTDIDAHDDRADPAANLK